MNNSVVFKKSYVESRVGGDLLAELKEFPETRKLMKALMADKELSDLINYANVVAIKRLGYNDHGPVHARIVTKNSIKVLKFLREAGVPTSLEKEEIGTFEDSLNATMVAAYLHDVGMSVTRQEHEWHSVILAERFVLKHLPSLYDSNGKVTWLKSLINECIVGHMAAYKINSLEAGVVLIADGTDMSRGRSRIPTLLGRVPAPGDIHKYSANSINRVEVVKGDKKPIRINVLMDDATGLFQVEEVLMTKVTASPVMAHLEICAKIEGQPERFYLQ